MDIVAHVLITPELMLQHTMSRKSPVLVYCKCKLIENLVQANKNMGSFRILKYIKRGNRILFVSKI